MDRKRKRLTRLATWSALLVVGTFVVMACRSDEPTPAPTQAPAATEAAAASAEASTAPVLASIEPAASEAPVAS